MKKNREPRWDEDFQFPLDEPPINDKLHVEVISSSSRMGLIHPKVGETLSDFFKSSFKDHVFEQETIF